MGFTPDGWSLWGMANVGSLEDIVGGHAWLSVMLIFGGIWHLTQAPKKVFMNRLIVNGDAILSYSLGGLAFMGFVSSAFVAHCPWAFPVDFYGDNLSNLVLVQQSLAVVALGGHLWHAYRARTA